MEQQQEQVLNFLNQAVDLAIDYGLDVVGALVILIGGWAPERPGRRSGQDPAPAGAGRHRGVSGARTLRRRQPVHPI